MYIQLEAIYNICIKYITHIGLPLVVHGKSQQVSICHKMFQFECFVYFYVYKTFTLQNLIDFQLVWGFFSFFYHCHDCFWLFGIEYWMFSMNVIHDIFWLNIIFGQIGLTVAHIIPKMFMCPFMPSKSDVGVILSGARDKSLFTGAATYHKESSISIKNRKLELM